MGSSVAPSLPTNVAETHDKCEKSQQKVDLKGFRETISTPNFSVSAFSASERWLYLNIIFNFLSCFY